MINMFYFLMKDLVQIMTGGFRYKWKLKII